MAERPTKSSKGAAVAAYAAAFATGKRDSMSVHAVRSAYTQRPQNSDAFCASSLGLLCDLLDMGSEERAFLHARRWPEFMGAVLLNEQERPLPSLYDMHRELVHYVAGGGLGMGTFEEARFSSPAARRT